MTTTIRLPGPGRTLTPYQLSPARAWPRPPAPPARRVAFAAAHVAGDPFGGNVPGAPAEVDWESTLAFREYLWSYGLGVAEAMDTSQRGMGLGWDTTKELIARSAALAAHAGGRIAAGAGTDQLTEEATLDEVIAAYEEQIEYVESTGARVIIMASRQLARAASGPDDYAKVYGRLLRQTQRPVILHWLGAMFDPALAGYWGAEGIPEATSMLLDIAREHADQIDGIKVSLLDAAHERSFRAVLPAGVRLYTGDDFHYPELIRGDAAHHSDALLGVFAAIAPAASSALQALDRDDPAGYDAAFGPTVPLARHVFGAPTYYYKTGIAFLAWLAGHQPGFTMIGGLQSARSALHLAQAFRLADAAGLFPDPALAAARMQKLLAVAGICDD